MRINIVPKRDNDHDCTDGVVSAIAGWMGRNYELIYCESWGFSYDKAKAEEGYPLGRCIDVGNYKPPEFLEKYHGIKTTIHNTQSAEARMEIIKSNLAMGQPVAMEIDCFWCPWFKEGYQIYHRVHFCIIVEYDEENGILHCVDGQMAYNGAELPVDYVGKGGGICLTFDLTHEESKGEEWKEIVKRAIDKLYPPDSISIFDAMRAFANDVEQMGLDIHQEMEGYEVSPTKTPLFWTIYEVGRCRSQFAKTLQYLEQSSGIKAFDTIIKNLKKIGDMWGGLFGILIKAFYMENTQMMVNKIASKIRECADFEEKIAAMLKEVYETNGIQQALVENEECSRCNEDIKQYYHIDLSEYANNQGFGDSISYECTAELSGGGKYLLTEGLPKEDIWTVGNMRFKFPAIDRKLNDNISCDGQQIQVDPKAAASIMFLGTAEYGNHSEQAEILYQDGTSEKIPLEFTNWGSTEALYGEAVAWSGKCIVRGTNEITIFPYDMKLFAKAISLKHEGQIVGIKLPQCMNIHIFAITLGI